MALFKKNEVPEIVESVEARAHREHLTRNFTIEVIPMKSLDNAREHLPAGAPLSVTASPVKGLEETQRLTEEFQAAGFEERRRSQLLGGEFRGHRDARVVHVVPRRRLGRPRGLGLVG